MGVAPNEGEEVFRFTPLLEGQVKNARMCLCLT